MARALSALAALRAPVDAFFDDVMVMDPDPALRANRLALLGSLRELFAGIADSVAIAGLGSRSQRRGESRWISTQSTGCPCSSPR